MMRILQKTGRLRNLSSHRLPRGLQSRKTWRCLTTSTNQGTPDSDARKPRIIFSGIQPTGVAHLGNYLGAIRPWVDIQNSSPPQDHLFFSVVDLHSLTSRSQQPAERHLAKSQTLAILIAAGLDPNRCTIFYQSSVPAHAELYWILGCQSGMGWLSRIPTWKDKLAMEMGRHGEDAANIDVSTLLQPSPNPKSEERLKLGLFTYPVLQAADILLYSTTHVPVGEDQLVNIQFAQGAATSFNALYGGGGSIDSKTGLKKKGKPILRSPEAIVSKAKRVMSLTEEGKKMSKSSPNKKGRVLITDDDVEIRKKFGGALTDSLDQQGKGISYDPERRPGVSNLLEIIANVGEADGTAQSPSEIAAEINGMQVEGSPLRVLKERAADIVVAHLRPVRERYFQLMGERSGKTLDDIVQTGASKAQIEARKTMQRVHRAVGF